MIKLYNVLTRKIEEVPKKNHLNLYTCGPTVYNFAHIGNLRAYILADLLYRTLKYDGYNPRWVMNITDIDDKTIKGAIDEFGPNATVEDLKKHTDKFFQAFLKDLEEVNVLSGSDDYHVYQPKQKLDFTKKLNFIKVTDVIPQIQEFVVELINKGYAYKAEDGSVYFNIEKYQKDFGDYGALVGEKFLEGKKVGARVKSDEYEKENLSDFALWKAWEEKDAQIFWDHPLLGKGRPGWHIECSVINKIGFNGEPTDIHTGGVDLIFPHHTNEIAQSQALVGKGNFVHHWFHSEHLLVDGKKMSKSAKNFYTLKDLLHPLRAWSLRYLFMQAHYRAQQNFTKESLDASGNRVVGLINHVSLSESNNIADIESLEDDLNVPKTISGSSEDFVFKQLLGARLNLDQYKEIDNLPDDIAILVKARNTSREQKDFKKSDELRKQIEDLGYEVMDTAEGQKIRKKIKL